jgi:uncharacterized membrane protein
VPEDVGPGGVGPEGVGPGGVGPEGVGPEGVGPGGVGPGGVGPGGTVRHGSVPADPLTNTVVKVVLRIGLSVALVLFVVGLVAQLAVGRPLAVDVGMFHLFAAPSFGEALMGLGVLVLTLTPVAGITSVVASWLRERDRGFAAVAAVVLVVLGAAVVVGLAG